MTSDDTDDSKEHKEEKLKGSRKEWLGNEYIFTFFLNNK